MDQPAPMLDPSQSGGITMRTISDEFDADVDPTTVVDQLERRFRIERRGKVKRDGVISDLFDRRILTIFERRFNSSRTGHQVLKAGEFQQLVSEYIPAHLVENIYRSIDVNDTGSVHYSDFINYLIASEEGSLFSNKTNTSRLVIHDQQVVEPDDSRNESHSDFIDCLCYLKKPQSMIATGGRDGRLLLWYADDLKCVRVIDHRDKNSVFEEELRRSMTPLLRAQCAKFSTRRTTRTPKVAITCLLPLHNTGMLCVGSADSCVTIYDLTNNCEVCGRYCERLQFIPTSMNCFLRSATITLRTHSSSSPTKMTTTDFLSPFAGSTMHQQQPSDESLLLHLVIADSSGAIHSLQLHKEFLPSLEAGMKKKAYSLFAQSMKNSCRVFSASAAAVTGSSSSWITDVMYIGEVDALLASTMGGLILFVDLLKGEVVRSFSGHRSSSSAGIRAFSWSHFGKYIVSAADRGVLFWDIFTLEVVTKIDNLKSPVVSVQVSDSAFKVFAILVNKAVLVWHSITFEFQQQIVDPSSYKPADNLSSMRFASDLQMLFTAGNKVTSWTLERSQEGPVEEDNAEDLCVALYNSLFNQVLVVKSFGLVKVYQCETGLVVRQFSVVPIDPTTSQPVDLQKDPLTGLRKPIIKHACFDKVQSRLIVTSHYDSKVQFWNINDGSSVIQFEPQLYSTSLSSFYSPLPKVISSASYDIMYTQIKQTTDHPKGTVTARHVSRQSDPMRQLKSRRKYVILGTQSGNICCYLESSSVVDSNPSFFLRYYDVNPFELSSATITSSRDTKPPPAPKPSSMTTMNRRGSAVKLLHHHRSSMMIEQQLLSAEINNPVLWTECLPDHSLLLAGYLDGVVAVWDLDSCSRMEDLCTSHLGPVLSGMRRKGDKPLQLLSRSDKAVGGRTTGAATAQQLPDRHDPLDEARSTIAQMMQGSKVPFAEQSSGNLAGGATDPDLKQQQRGTLLPHAPIISRNRRKSTAVFQRLVNAASVKNAVDLQRTMTPTAATAERHEEAEGSSDDDDDDSVSDNLTTHRDMSVAIKQGGGGRVDDGDPVHESGQPIQAPEVVVRMTLPSPRDRMSRRDSASIVRGSLSAASSMRRSSNAHARYTVTLNPFSKLPTQVELGYAAPLARQSGVKENAKTESDDGAACDDGTAAAAVEGSAAEKPSSGAVSSGGREEGSSSRDGSSDPVGAAAARSEDASSRVGVDALLVLRESGVLIGACTDRYLRFWDLNTSHILCSCVYYHATPAAAAVVDENEILRIIKSSDSEDAIIGAYDNGMIRVWSVQSYSLVTLKGLLSRHLNVGKWSTGTGSYDLAANTGAPFGNRISSSAMSSSFGTGTMAISPITLMYQWHAHSSPFISIDYIWFSYQTAPVAAAATEAAVEKEDRSVSPSKGRPSMMMSIAAATTLPGSPASHSASSGSNEDLDPEGGAMTAADFELSSRAGSPVMTVGLDNANNNLRPKRRRNNTASFLSAVDSNIAAALNNIRLTAKPTHSLLPGHGSVRVKRQKQSDMGQSVLDGFILSAGLDQRVFLWSLTGRCVGQFGCHDWDINIDTTWSQFKEVGGQQDMAAKKRAAAQQGATLLRFDRDKTSACNIVPDTDIKDLVRSPSTRMLQADLSQKKKGHSTSHELNTYVVALSKKLAQRSAIYTDADEHFRHMLDKYPIVEIEPLTRRSSAGKQKSR